MQQPQEEENMREEISKLQDEYYEKNNKNIFFKKSQKYDCASAITQQYDINVLFKKTLFVLKEGEIYFDYTFFKTYIHPEIYEAFLEYINVISFQCIDKMSQYTLHLNFQTLRHFPPPSNPLQRSTRWCWNMAPSSKPALK